MQPKRFVPAALITALSIFHNLSFAQIGNLNTFFGNNGFVKQRFHSNSNAFTEIATDIISLSDGNSIIAIQADNRTILSKFSVAGVLDTTFADGGYSEFVRMGECKLARTADGHIYAAGYFSQGFGLALFNSNGYLDKRFGIDGVVTTLLNDKPAHVNELLIQPDGKVLAAGLVYNGTNYDIFLTRFHADGSLDISFGSAGKVMTDFGYSDYGYAAALQPDGKIVVSGGITTANGFNNMSTVRYHADGSLDTGFGSGGKVISIQNVSQAAQSVKIKPDGKILVAGGNRDFILLGYKPNGALDNTFGINGMVATHFISAPEVARTMEILEDGKIIVAGDLTIADQTFTGLARFYPNGTLDESFGNSGKTKITFSQLNSRIEALKIKQNGKLIAVGFVQPSGGAPTDYALLQCGPDGLQDKTFGVGGQVIGFVDGEKAEFRSIAVQRDQKLVVSGFTNGANDADFALARYHLNGNLDTSFGMNGKVVSNFGNQDLANAVAILPDDKILAAGILRTSINNSDILLARYHSNGILDSTFGQYGKVITDINVTNDHLTSIAIQQDHKILAGGSTNATGQSALLLRYLPNGILDHSFGQSGKIISTFSYPVSFISSIKVLLSGKIIALVKAMGATGNSDIILALYNSDGTLDASFGKNGMIITDFSATDAGESMEIQADGKIIIGGFIGTSTVNADFVLLRYNSDGSLDQSFGQNGKVQTDFGAGDMGQSLSLQPNGSITMIGNRVFDKESVLNLVRFKANGTLDSSFGQNGMVISDLEGDHFFTKSAIVGNNLYTIGSIRQISTYASIASYILRVPAQISSPTDVTVNTSPGTCVAVVAHIDPVLTPQNTDEIVNYRLTGATTGVGRGSVSGLAFNNGVTTVTYSLLEEPAKIDSFTITVQDNEAPKIENLTVDSHTLWPVDHKMIDIVVDYTSTDNCSQPNTNVQIACNEVTGATSSNNNQTDWEVVNEHLVRLRAERSGTGYGRIYTIKVQATDDAGNATTKTITVLVPKKELDIKVFNNPTSTYFTIKFSGANMVQRATLRIMNSMGKTIEIIHNIAMDQTLQIGSSYRPGLYFIELIQGGYREQAKVIKQ